MKLKKTISVLLALLLIAPTVFADEESFEIDENFDKYTDITTLPAEWVKSAKTTIEEGENGGKMLRLGLDSGTDNYQTIYNLKNTVSSGGVRISYSFCPGERISTIVWIYSSDGAAYPITFISPDGTLTSGRASTSKADTIVKKGLALSEWYDVVAIVDIDDSTIKVSVSDRNGNTYSAKDRKIPDIIGKSMENISQMRFQVWSKQDSESYIDDLKIAKEPILMTSVTSERTGNNFGHDEIPQFQFDVKNTSEDAHSVTAEWRVLDEEGVSVLEEKETIELEAHGTKSMSALADVPKYGLYAMYLKIMCDGRECDSRTLKFSKFLSSDEGERSDILGFAAHLWRNGNIPENLELMQRAGSAGWRDGAEWQRVEQKYGVLYLDPTGKDELIEHARKGMENTHILHYGNTIHVEQTDKYGNKATPNSQRAPKTEADLEGWRQYCRYIANETKDYVSSYEVWNEFDGHFNADRLGGEAYVKILKIAYEEVKKVNPNATVVGLGGTGTNSGGETFIKEVFENGGGAYCDAVSIHPYDRDLSYPSENWIEKVRKLEALIDSYGEHKPVYFTEIGWHSATESTNKNHPYVTERKQAENIIKIGVVSKAYGLAEKVNIYDFQEDGDDHAEEESCYGSVTSNTNSEGAFLAKPSFLSFAAVNKMLPEGTIYQKSVELSEYKTAAHCFRREDGKNIAVMWTEGIDDFSLNLGCNDVAVYDMYGNRIENVHAEDGIFDFGLTNGVIFIEGSFSSFERADTMLSCINSAVGGVKNDIITIEIDGADGEYLIETDYNKDIFTLAEEPYTADGKALVRYRVSNNAFGNYNFNIRLYDGDECVYVFRNTVNIGNPVNVSMSTNQVSKTNDKRWQLEVDIENYANNTSISGVCRVTKPEEFAEFCKEYKFTDVEPKKTRKLFINLPQMLKKRTQDVEVEIELDYGYRESFETNQDFTSARYAYTKPVIDGKIDTDEWKAALVCSDRPSNVEEITAGTHVWRGTDDLSISLAKLMWDEDNFYLAAVVSDNEFVPGSEGSSLWQYDSIQFTIEDKFYNVENMARFSFTEIGVALLKDGPCVYRFASEYAQPSGVVEACEVAVKKDDNNIIYELKIPWSEIFKEGYEFNPDYIYGFAMLANDNDGSGRWGWIKYNDGIGRNKDATLFGRMRVYK